MPRALRLQPIPWDRLKEDDVKREVPDVGKAAEQFGKSAAIAFK